jgi:hypothetical protein
MPSVGTLENAATEVVDEILEITFFIAEVLERIGVPYLVGGSLASSFHGVPRATQDVDLVAALGAEHVPALIAALEGRFYHDADTIREAVRDRTSFNVIHLDTLFKVDIFVARQDPATRQELDRRQRITVGTDPTRELVVASAEDVVAQKLYWFRLGDGVSDRQWSDALGVLKVAGERLDLDYLRKTAGLLGVEDLLEKALAEAREP